MRNLSKLLRSVFLMAALLIVSVGIVHGQDEATDGPCEDPVANQLTAQAEGGFWEDTNFCQAIVSFDEFRAGGPPPDGIPPIDEEDVMFDSIEEASEWLQDQSPVISFEYEGEARAYPLAIMTRHEIVNDLIGEDDRPIAVTFCPLCNSAIVFDRVVDGEKLRLGVSGILRNSDLVMWDNETRSWWQQFTGEALVGDFVGEQLTILPSQVVSFEAFAEEYPDGVVLAPESGFGGASYGSNPYEGYDSRQEPFGSFFTEELDERLPALERVLAGTVGGEPIAYPFSVLEEELVINDTIGEREVVAFWQPGKASALDSALIDSSRDVGMATLYRRTVDDQTLTFAVNDDGEIIDEETGSVWNVFGRAVEGELEGTRLRQELAAPHFWFAWAAFSPETAIYGQENEE